MDSVSKKLWAVLAFAVPATAVCAQATGSTVGGLDSPSVAAVLHDKESYLARQFTPEMLPKQLIGAVVRSESGHNDFKRISIDAKVVYDKAGAAVPQAMESSDLYVGAGHGFVKQLVVTKANGFEVSDLFALTYQGLITLSAQTVPANATAMPRIINLSDFQYSDGSISGAHFGYQIRGGVTEQLRYDCKAGASYPGSQLNPDIQGQAHDVDCQVLNANGIAMSTIRYSYLEKYGLAILMHSKTMVSEFSKTLAHFSAE
ncbi:hypothetical protein IHE49_08960 [Rhodanobacter sp. 7MK24]|uniref:hypothetical protein n=1 Tax=Rhodanobacter sp. 7MK24 TaxID=2775922 RepID=UPI00177E1116|nr:hypothetical protein [Rhodanobacter sp. 7MK24]MBD8880612.1 hypothetical protein [Rhodanobacter sp. 7MK24]